MANIMDYIKWRGDLDFNQSEFNDIDNLILARFSYFPLDHIYQQEEVVTINKLHQRFQKLENKKEKILQKEDLDLFPAMAKSKRFGELRVVDYRNKLDPEQEKQFSVVTIQMSDNTILISYRGTDNTIIGWKEDLNMSFKPQVASQLDSVHYLETIAKKYPKKLIRITGHSKGGNLAVYAPTFVLPKIQNRILAIYNNDGPGFDEKIIQTENYQKIIPKVHTIIPQTSIIGRLLNHQEKYMIIKSTQVGIMQHDLYTWQLEGKEFITLNEVTNGSEFVDQTITAWLKKVTPEQRGQFIDTLFEILNQTEVNTLSELGAKKFSNARIILKSYQNIDEESKVMISQTLSALFQIATSNLVQKLPKIKRKK